MKYRFVSNEYSFYSLRGEINMFYSGSWRITMPHEYTCNRFQPLLFRPKEFK